jgi:predicted MFS family arabinose efflux permease
MTGVLQVPDRLVNRPVPTLLATSMSITLGALPIFLVGAMAVFIRPELGFGESALGALATLYYLSSALTTVPAGRLAERLGGPRTMAVAAVVSTGVFLGIAVLARSWLTLALFLVVAGVANGIAFPGSNLAFARGFPPSRQGIGYAIKQSAGPYATMISGAAVPIVGLTVGWRWAFAMAALLAIPIIAGGGIRQEIPRHARATAGYVPRGPVWILALAAFCAVNASAALGAFYVESAVSKGVGVGIAGALLSVGSGFGIACRIGWGWIADRRPSVHFRLLPGILGTGAVSIWLLGVPKSGAVLALVTLAAFGTGWAWPSLLNFAVLSRMPGAEGVASGIIGAGQYGGGILGPLGFGVLVERASYQVAWTMAGTMLALAAACSVIGGRRLERAVSERTVT